jgi:hypothetical protein
LLKSSGIKDLIAASQLLKLWQVRNEQLTSLHYNSLDQQSFEKWNHSFNELCRAKNFIVPSQLFEIVTQAIKTNKLPLNESFYFYGFDESHPALTQLQEGIASKTSLQHLNELGEASQYQTLVSSYDFEYEVKNAAIWAQAIAKENEQARVAVIIPSINQNRELVESIFLKQLNPEMLNLYQEDKEPDFNISSGIPLSETALVKSALQTFSLVADLLLDKKIEHRKLRETFNSPFLLQGLFGIEQGIQLDKLLSSQRNGKSTTTNKKSYRRFLKTLPTIPN